ncbi:hypothetical protein B0J14DRAFT_521661 [Halenospora varia]|nr:hypothetical protein B0J14DRAFT_521661 [Halenospora varia]
MKFNTSLLLLAAQFSGILAVAVSSRAEECGDLGVMDISSIDLASAGLEAEEVRACEAHPMGDSRVRGDQDWEPLTDEQLTANNQTLTPLPDEDSSCYYKAGSGCSGGYCWKACGTAGDGKWCWLAYKGGYGDWQKCSKYTDCGGVTTGCGAGCITSGSCGCSC